jgi:hypothetical protein
VIAALKIAGLALGVALAGSVEYDPQLIAATLANGAQLEIPATNADTCETGARALTSGLWRIEERGEAVPVVRAECRAGYDFVAPCPECRR